MRSCRYSNFHWSVWLNGVKIYLLAQQGACSTRLAYTQSDWESYYSRAPETSCTFKFKKSLNWSKPPKTTDLQQTNERRTKVIGLPLTQVKQKLLTSLVIYLFNELRRYTDFFSSERYTLKVRARVTFYLYDFCAWAPIGRQVNRSNSLLCLSYTCFATPTSKHARCSWNLHKISRFLPRNTWE